MKPNAHYVSEDLRAEYDFDYSKGVRGKYHKRILKEGANVVVLEPDVAKAFPDSAAVNDALRVVLKAGQADRGLTTRPSRTARKRAPRLAQHQASKPMATISTNKLVSIDIDNESAKVQAIAAYQRASPGRGRSAAS